MPQTFWGLTPHQLNLCVQSYNEKMIGEKNDWIRLSYNHMRMMRTDVKHLPKLESLLIGQKKKVPVFDEGAIISQMKAYNAALDKKQNKKGNKNG